MPKDKEKKFNPVAAAAKAEKNKAIKKSKAANLAQRTERLAKKNPWHLQKQLDELKAAKERGELDARHLERIEGLEKEVRAIRKAREEMGIKDDEPRERRGGDREGRGQGVLGKRRRDGEDGRRREDESETDEEARGVPMPADHENEPPIPRRRYNKQQLNNGEERKGPHPLPEKPSKIETKAVYEAAPELRDLHKEAAQKFIPRAVAERMRKAKGQGGLLQPEELDELEKAGYKRAAEKVVDEAGKEALHNAATAEQPDVAMDEELRRLEEEIEVIDDAKPGVEEAKEFAQKAVDEAEKELIHDLMETEAKGGETLKPAAQTRVAPPLPGLVAYSDSEDDEDEDEANDIAFEAEQAADAAEKEAEFNMMADEEFDEFGNPVKQAEKVEQHLRRVEIEEVEDEDL